MKYILAALALMTAPLAMAQPTDVGWPREVKAKDGTVITVYQPQLERWANNQLVGRAAVAVAKPGQKDPRFGVVELTARTDIDKSADTVMLSNVSLAKGSFPGTSPQESEAYLATLRAALPKQGWPVSAQALQANLAIVQARAGQKQLQVKNDPPQVVFRTVPSLLVLVDGEPALRPAKDAPELMRVINSTALMLQDPASSTWYLWALNRWWQAKAITEEWGAAVSPPASLERVRAASAKTFEPHDGNDAEGKPRFDAGVVPKIVVATKPTELLQSRGEPQFAPIPGTQLLYMGNSPNDIFMELGGQAYFVVISGRWFSAKALAGPWTFVPTKNLPPDFAKIPPDHPAGDVLAAVAGTPQAKEAAIANQIPQTARVQRDIVPSAVVYDGEPEWRPIENTSLSYAANTGTPVIRVDTRNYYMVQNGVWFVAGAPRGVWTVATTVPVVIYTIPPSSPLHYVTYVHVYSSTATTVLVGYTPGYYGTVVSSDGVVVYGTGYVYPPYIGTVWYPYPPTYGFGFYFSVGFFWGFGGGYPPYYGGCCWGAPPMVVHHGGMVTVNNSYNRWGGKSTSITGPGGRNLTATQVGNTTLAKGSGSNNVYAGRDGEVYRRNENGDWQKYEGKGDGWSDVGGRGERPNNDLPGDKRGERPNQDLPGDRGNRAETRGSLDRDFQSRQAGEARSQQFRSSGGFQGGGGARMGGGGGRGGRR
jgi:hypothetical protein